MEHEKALLGFYFLRLRYEGKAELLDFSFASDDPKRAGKVKVARFHLPCDSGDSVWFTGTLGIEAPPSENRSSHHHQFVGIYDTNSLELSELVAAALHYDRTIAGLDYGHTFPLAPMSSLRLWGYSTALVLDAGLYEFFRDGEAEIAGVSTSFFSIVPIETQDLTLKQAGGLGALLEAWDRRRYDILKVKTRAPM